MVEKFYIGHKKENNGREQTLEEIELSEMVYSYKALTSQIIQVSEQMEKWDAPSFDPNYSNLELEFFRPIVEKVLVKSTFWDWNDDIKKDLVVGSSTKYEN